MPTKGKPIHATPSWASYIGPAWTVGAGMLGLIVAAITFYVTTSGTLERHNSAINKLTDVLKEESKARIDLEKNESLQREKLRAEYLAHVKEQTSAFTGVGKEVGTIAAEVKVLGSRYESINDRLKQVIDQTSPTATGSSTRRR